MLFNYVHIEYGYEWILYTFLKLKFNIMLVCQLIRHKL